MAKDINDKSNIMYEKTHLTKSKDKIMPKKMFAKHMTKSQYTAFKKK